MGEEQRRLRELRIAEARLRAREDTDAVSAQLDALRRDIEAAQSDLDDVIEASRERAKRWDEDDQGDANE